MEENLIRLNVVGITYNQIENGMYALILEDEDGSRRLPIIIGYNEAQSIECLLQKIKTPRPLTHELTSGIIESFGIDISSVVIKQLENGIFAADITLNKDGESHKIDGRSSDAIALAMRANAPIYTSRQLLNNCGIEKDSLSPRLVNASSRKSIPVRTAIERVKNPSSNGLTSESLSSLKRMMEEAVRQEDYEKAEEIKREIDKRHDNT